MLKKQVCALAGCMMLIFSHAALAAENDPYEKFNRLVFNFNDFFDRALLKPVATLYNKIMPKPLNKGINNMFSNIDMIPTIINDCLQGNFYQSFSDTWRLGVNSTIGIAGFFDVASEIGLSYHDEDFGLTLARWGYKNSNYLVLPFIGPATIRDGIAWPVNYDVLTVYPYLHPDRTRYALYAGNYISKRATALRYQGVMDEVALDKYAFQRDAYLQHRNNKIKRNDLIGAPFFGKKGLDNAELTDES